jgi:hypothetical protein
MAMKLIHAAKYFTKDEILRRAEYYEYPNPLAVEIFLWDFELAAQSQILCDKSVLKGGAAAQLYLPLERQRGSVDVDLATSLEKKDVEEVILQLGKTLEGRIEFSRYEPKKPNPKLPLLTYLASVPSLVDPKREELDIKLDFLCESPELPHVELHDVQTFALTVKRVRCSTAGPPGIASQPWVSWSSERRKPTLRHGRGLRAGPGSSWALGLGAFLFCGLLL